MWALGNVASDSPRCRDIVLRNGALIPLLSQLNEHAMLSMLRNATWTLSNFFRGKPQPPFEQTRPAFLALQRLVHSNDEEVLTDACWALSYFSDGTNDIIQVVIEAGVCQRLVELLLYVALCLFYSLFEPFSFLTNLCLISFCILVFRHRSPSVLIPALRTVGNIVTGDDGQTQCVGHLSLSLHNPWRSLWRFFEAVMGMRQLLDNLPLAPCPSDRNFRHVVNVDKTFISVLYVEAPSRLGKTASTTCLTILGIKFSCYVYRRQGMKL